MSISLYNMHKSCVYYIAYLSVNRFQITFGFAKTERNEEE